MNKFINTLKALDPMLAVALVLMFAAGLIVGQQITSREEEVVENNPYKALTLAECVTDWECETAQLIADNRDGKLVRTDDPVFFPDSVPVIEPVDCETGDKECEKANKLNAGKSAHYPRICGPYIFSNEHKERNL